MNFEVYKTDSGELVIQPGEELGYVSVSEFSGVLQQIKCLSPISKLTYDLKNTQWIDSVGLGMMYNTYISLRREVSAFSVINAHGQALKTIKLGQLGRQYKIVPGDPAQRTSSKRA